ncbi:hypothetical protein PAPHI01_0386 [Pancytospora philotis]|nr:hypothetical protein PAPHI01_0360 [Pancytospora philotis]KAI4291112.1 hypothetical protein PAPHI01_0386 [Pancytospora philotis]
MPAAGYMLLLMLIGGSFSMPEHAVDRDPVTPNDYMTFGDITTYSINTLEARVLEPLYRHCIHFHNTARPTEKIGAQLDGVPVRDMEIFVITAVLIERDPLILLDELLTEFGYASHYLLAKLFSPGYTRFLKTQLELPSANTSGCTLKLLLQSHDYKMKLQEIYKILRVKVMFELSKALVEYARAGHNKNNSFDYAIFTLARNDVLGQAGCSGHAEILQHWLAGDSESHRSVPFVRDYLRIILLPDLLPIHRRTIIKKEVVILVARQHDKKYLELLDTFENMRATKIAVLKHVQNQGKHGINPFFMAHYAEFIKKASNSVYDEASIYFWAEYLETPVVFIRTKSIWNEYPLFFNMIGRAWLQKFFIMLSDESITAGLDRNITVRKYVNMLEFDTFIEITQGILLERCIRLIDFMLQHMDEIPRNTYLSRAQTMKGLHPANSNIESRLKFTINRLKILSGRARDTVCTARRDLKPLHNQQQPRVRKRMHSIYNAPGSPRVYTAKRRRRTAPYGNGMEQDSQ